MDVLKRNSQLKNNIISLEEEVKELEKEKIKKKAKLSPDELKTQILESLKKNNKPFFTTCTCDNC